MRRLRPFRIVLILAFVVVAAVVGAFWVLPTILYRQYFGMRHKSAEYYVELAGACDSVIAKHLIVTGPKDFFAISPTDPSLPKVITDLKPIKIKVSKQSFWMLLGSDSHEGFGVTWDPSWNDTNVWILHTTMESQDTVIYSSKRASLANISR